MVYFIDCSLTKYTFQLLLSHPPFFSSWPYLFVKTLTGCPSLSEPHLSCQSLSLSGFNSPLSAVSVDGDVSLAVASQNVFNPGQQGANFGVNTWVARQSTAIAPGDNAVQLPVAHQRTARVTLSAEEERRQPGSGSRSRPIRICSTLPHSTRGFILVLHAHLPDRHPCLPLDNQHTPCGQWAAQDRSTHSRRPTQWGPPHIGG